jgi:hypothetical protein
LLRCIRRGILTRSGESAEQKMKRLAESLLGRKISAGRFLWKKGE